MSKFLIRIITLLLLPCLMADPGLAGALHNSISPSRETANIELFTQEAFAPRADCFSSALGSFAKISFNRVVGHGLTLWRARPDGWPTRAEFVPGLKKQGGAPLDQVQRLSNLDRLSVAVPIRLGAAALFVLGLHHAHFLSFFHSGHETLPLLSMAFSRRDLFSFSHEPAPLEAPPPGWVLRRLGIITGNQWDKETSQRMRDQVERSSPETIARTLRGAIPSLTLDEWNAAWDYVGLYYAPGDHLVTPVDSLNETQNQSPGKVVARCLLEAFQQQPSSVQTERTPHLVQENPLRLTRRVIFELLAALAPLTQKLIQPASGLHPEIGLSQIPLQLGPEARRILEKNIRKYPGLEPLRRMPLHLWSEFIARVYPPVYYSGRWEPTPIGLPAEAADQEMHIRLNRKLPSLQEARAMARETTLANMNWIDAMTHVNAQLHSEGAGRPPFQLYTEADAANTINDLRRVSMDTWLADFENRGIGSIFFGSSRIANLVHGISKVTAQDIPDASEPSNRVSAPSAAFEPKNMTVPHPSVAVPDDASGSNVSQQSPGFRERITRTIAEDKDTARVSPGIESVGPLWEALGKQGKLSEADVSRFFRRLDSIGTAAERAMLFAQWAQTILDHPVFSKQHRLFTLFVAEIDSLLSDDSHAAVLTAYARAMQVWLEPRHPALTKLQANSPNLIDRILALRKKVEEKQAAKRAQIMEDIAPHLSTLESLSGAEILDSAAEADHETTLLRIDEQLTEMEQSNPPAALPVPLQSLRLRLTTLVEKVDIEIKRRGELVPAAAAPKLDERTVQLAKLTGARDGVTLANILAAEFNVDRPTAKQLVIAKNQKRIDFEGLLDLILAMQQGAIAPAEQSQYANQFIADHSDRDEAGAPGTGAFWLEPIKVSVRMATFDVLETLNGATAKKLTKALQHLIKHAAPGSKAKTVTEKLQQLENGQLAFKEVLQVLGLNAEGLSQVRLTPDPRPIARPGDWKATIQFVSETSEAGELWHSLLTSQEHAKSGAPLGIIVTTRDRGPIVLIPQKAFSLLTKAQQDFVIQHEIIELNLSQTRRTNRKGPSPHAQAIRAQGGEIIFNRMVAEISALLRAVPSDSIASLGPRKDGEHRYSELESGAILSGMIWEDPYPDYESEGFGYIPGHKKIKTTMFAHIIRNLLLGFGLSIALHPSHHMSAKYAQPLECAA